MLSIRLIFYQDDMLTCLFSAGVTACLLGLSTVTRHYYAGGTSATNKQEFTRIFFTECVKNDLTWVVMQGDLWAEPAGVLPDGVPAHTHRQPARQTILADIRIERENVYLFNDVKCLSLLEGRAIGL
jgi:hypothetical protein